jgi:hypothetical protein
VTIVNVLRHNFRADLPREPDDHYVSVEAKPYHFVRVEPTWVAAGDTVARPVFFAAPR